MCGMYTEKARNEPPCRYACLGDYCYISKGLVLYSHEDSDDEEFKKVDLISNTKNKIHCRKFLEGKGCGKYTSYRVRYLEYGALQRKRLLLSKADKN